MPFKGAELLPKAKGDKSGLLCVYGSQNVALQPAASASSRNLNMQNLGPHPKPAEFRNSESQVQYLVFSQALQGIAKDVQV